MYLIAWCNWLTWLSDAVDWSCDWQVWSNNFGFTTSFTASRIKVVPQHKQFLLQRWLHYCQKPPLYSWLVKERKMPKKNTNAGWICTQ
jgi:hypothetical protein